MFPQLVEVLSLLRLHKAKLVCQVDDVGELC